MAKETSSGGTMERRKRGALLVYGAPATDRRRIAIRILLNYACSVEPRL